MPPGAENADGLLDRGLAFKEQRRFGEAEACYRQALQLRPDFVEAHNNLGIVLALAGRTDEALASIRRALTLKPDHASAHNNLGKLLQGLGKLKDAEASFRQALLHRHDYARAHYNLSVVLADERRLDEAEASYRAALGCQPDLVEAHAGLGEVLRALGNYEEALASLQQALHLRPGFALAHVYAGTVLRDQGRLAEATAHFQEALRLEPSPRVHVLLATMLPPVYSSLQELRDCRARFAEAVARLHEDQIRIDLTRELAIPVFYLPYQGYNDRDLQEALAGLYVSPVAPVGSAKNVVTASGSLAGGEQASRSPPRRVEGKIKIGFLSAYFKNHTIGRLTQGLIARLSREAFSVCVLSVGSYRDETARFIQGHVDTHIELPGHLPTARDLIAGEQLDVLFYPEIGMDAMTCTLAFSRLAPVQCVTWGHPVTTGIPTIDYFISSDLLETANAGEHYTERLVRLKTLPIYYHRPALRASDKNRADYGLPDDAHLYGCLQSIFKFHPEFDDLLGDILRRDPQGRLVLLQGWSRRWDGTLRQRFARTMPDVVDRIQFVPLQAHDDFLSLTAACDVLLDPIHFGGGNTTYEALALGVPVVTLPSAFLRGRISLALYSQMQVLDCIADSPDGYVKLAVKLGADSEYREIIRSKILAANGVLYENAQGVRELEAFLQEAVNSSS